MSIELLIMLMLRIVSSVFELFCFCNVPNWLVPHILLEKLKRYPRSIDLETIFKKCFMKKKNNKIF